MFNEAFNHGKRFTFDSDKLPFMNLDDYVKANGNKEFLVREVFINPKSKFGPRPVIVSNEAKINMPNHFVKDIEKILARPDMIEAINGCHCSFTPEQYTDKNGVTRNSGHFNDI